MIRSIGGEEIDRQVERKGDVLRSFYTFIHASACFAIGLEQLDGCNALDVQKPQVSFPTFPANMRNMGNLGVNSLRCVGSWDRMDRT